jgi:hypothetical protein
VVGVPRDQFILVLHEGIGKMKPYLILLQYNGYNKTVIINHIDEKSALYIARKKYPDVLYCEVIK